MSLRFDPQTVPAGRYLVTGACGFIGKNLVQAIQVRGGEVLAVDVRPPAEGTFPDHGVTFAACDLRDNSAVARVVREAGSLQGAVHLAAKLGDWGTHAEFAEINVTATRHVLEALNTHGCRRIVHVSSVAAMGFAPGFGAGPDQAPVRCGDPYSDTKAEGEEIAREMQSIAAPLCIVRPGDVYGTGSEPWVERPLRMLRSKQMLFVDGGLGHFAHTHVDNLVHGLLLALTHEAAIGRCFIVSDGVAETTYRTYFTRLAQTASLPVPKTNVPRPVAMALGATLEALAHMFGFTPPITRSAVRFVTKRCSFDIGLAVRDLGYSPKVSLDEGLRRIGAVLHADGSAS
jgi:nucleoside-diphosphate-sugar epimerase